MRNWMEVIGDRTLNPCMASLAGMAESVVLGRVLIFDLQRMDVEFVQPERMADCTACGTSVPAGVGS